jgi:CheY-like chemotaxis protein
MQSSRANASTCTVLLIEDEAEQLAFWSNALRSCASQYSVLEATTDQEGLELLVQHKIDCVILDLDLSATSGFQLLLDLVPNRHRPEIAVLILTHLWNPTLAQLSIDNGAQAHLIKGRTSADSLDRAIQHAVTAVASARV